MDESRMAGGATLLFRMASAGPARNRRTVGCRSELDFSWHLVSFLPGMRQLQSGGAGFVVCYFPGEGFFRAAHDSVWLRLSGGAADPASALPAERPRSAVADSAPFLPLGEHARIMVDRDDYLFDHCRGGAGPVEMGNGRERTLDTITAKKLAARLGCERGFAVRESLWSASGVLPARPCLSSEAQH